MVSFAVKLFTICAGRCYFILKAVFCEGFFMAKNNKAAHSKVATVMRKYKHGALKNGKSGKPVKIRKQAIAIGLSEARKK